MRMLQLCLCKSFKTKMLLLQAFLSIFIVHFSATSTDKEIKMQYLLAVPSVLQSDSPNTGCVQLLNLREPVDLNVLLEYEGRNITILTESVTRQHFFKCGSFMVPNASPNPLAFITLSFKGRTLNGTERRAVAIQNRGILVFIQTDKPIYKPGETVFFRVVALDTTFKPVPQTYSLISVQDPQDNRILQWTNVTSNNLFIESSFNLSGEPFIGNYQIIVEDASATKTTHSFSVEEYVLPKFEVTLSAPKTVSVENPDFVVKVCGAYTYGQPVEGRTQLSVCRNLNFYGRCSRDPVCEFVSKELGKDGCFSHIFSSKRFDLNRSGYWMNLDVKATVTEKGTGVQIESSASISISAVLGTVRFENMDQDYRKGIPYCGQIRLVDVADAPLANETVQLLLDNKNVGNHSTDTNGTAQFCIDTSDMLSPTFSLRLVYKPNEYCNSEGWLLPSYPEAFYSVQRFYSRTSSFVKIRQISERLPCGQLTPIQVSYILNVKRDNPDPTATFFYLVLVKNKIVHFGHQNVSLSRAPRGSFSVPLKVSPDLAPVATLLVYTLHPEREVVADTARFQIERCFKNKVRLQFSEKQARPGSKISLWIDAAANSQCALRAVDQSVLLLRPERELSAESVYSLLPYEMTGYYFNGLSLEDDPQEPCIPPDNIFHNGLFYVPADFSSGPDAYELIKQIGLKLITDSRLQQPVVCSRGPLFRPSLNFPGAEARFVSSASDGPPLPPSESVSREVMIETVRKFFPETWIWDLVPVNSTGRARLSYHLPDTITEWKAGAFCVGKEAGFGISPPASLTAFQPFFVDLTLPYSIIRGEDFLLKANVFNYLDKCIQVTVSLAPSRDFQAQLLSPADNDGCVCGNERKTYIWNIVSRKLGAVEFSVTAAAPQNSRACGNGTAEHLDVGRKDTLIRTLLIEPEGVEREATHSSLLCTKDGGTSESVSLLLPKNLVEGSARAYFSCIGDLMGTAMRNLQQLLRLPYGCGEQNMVLFAPNIYVLDYLNATGQLTEEIRSKAVGYLVSGYQRQLLYKHPDGSYSAFGSRDREGNAWLTAFVYKSFASAARYIFIDPKAQQQSLIWLSGKQKANGCFQNVGKLFNNALKGGVEEELSLSAYITSALLESGLPTSHPVVRNALYCLETGLKRGNLRVYEEAHLAYAFGLAGNRLQRDSLLEKLTKSAKKAGGSLHWERDTTPAAEEPPSFDPPAPSAEVEMTSYVLLAMLTEAAPSSAQRTTASQIVQWVAKQQNPYGGFSTTQDTVVALQALAQYSKLSFSKDGRLSVRIRSKKPFEKVFGVENGNRFLLQQVALPGIPGDYAVQVNGSGCVFVQTAQRYNIILPRRSSGFVLSVQPVNASCVSSFQTKFTLVITARYSGSRNASNMAVLDVKMLTGFRPDPSSLQTLRNNRVVMKVETKENHVLCYLDGLSNKEISFSFMVVQDLPVLNLKPASVHLYDYYETDENSVAEYKSPCNESTR